MALGRISSGPKRRWHAESEYARAAACACGGLKQSKLTFAMYGRDPKRINAAWSESFGWPTPS